MWYWIYKCGKMATVALRIIPYLSRILRIDSLFGFANEVKKVNTVLRLKDIEDLVDKYNKSKEFANWLKKQIFSNAYTHEFVFFSEEELKNYIHKIDNRAEIVKIMEFKEVDLYLVRFSDVRLFLNIKNENILEELANLMFLNQLFIYMNDYLFTNLKNIRNIEKLLENKLIEYVNNYIKYLETQKSNLEQKINEIINKYKEEDINNTYCIKCSCCCSCDKGSCCCSCECNLVHYIQSWEDAKNEIIENIEIVYNDEIEKLKNDFINKNNKNSYIYLLYNELANKENNKSLIMLFLFELEKLLFNYKHKAKHCLLFAVIKVKAFKKKIRTIYHYIKENYANKIVDYKKFKEDLRFFILREFNEDIKDNLLNAYLSRIKKMYSVKIIKINDKEAFIKV